VATHEITVNNLLPGRTHNKRVQELARAASEKEGFSAAECQMGNGNSDKALGLIARVCSTRRFLVSERASYITGTSITVYGEWIRSQI